MKFNIEDFKMGDLIVYKHEDTHWFKGFFGNAIVRKQLNMGFIPAHAQYSHTEICGGGIYKDNQRVGIRSVRVALPRSKVVDILKAHKGRYITVFRHIGYKTDNTARYKVAYTSALLNNLAYDKRGVVAFTLSFIKQDNRLYFCSEHTAYALRSEFPKTFNNIPNAKIMPAHSFTEQRLEKVFECRLPK